MVKKTNSKDTQDQKAQQGEEKKVEANNNQQNKISSIIKQEHEKQINKLKEEYEAKLAQAEDLKLRAMAEGQNVARRAQKSVEDARNYAIRNFAEDLTKVLDNLFRASDAITDEDIKNNEKLKAFKDGIDITKKEMITAFEKNNIERVNPKGEKFNHDLHEAISQVPSPDHESGIVIDVVQTGYTLNGRILKPALVVVAQ